jgi:hypothetical protein
MASLRSGYEPESSLAATARRNSEFVELQSTHHLHEEATNNTSGQPSAHDAESASATIEDAHAVAALLSCRTSNHDSNIELNAINPQYDEVGVAEAEFSLPPVDSGKDAWLFLFSAFIMDILVWGTFFLDHFQVLLLR